MKIPFPIGGWCVTFSVDGSVMHSFSHWADVLLSLQMGQLWRKNSYGVLSSCAYALKTESCHDANFVSSLHWWHWRLSEVIILNTSGAAMSFVMMSICHHWWHPQVFMKTTSSATSGIRVTLCFQCIKLTKRIQNHNRMITNLEWLFICDSYDWWFFLMFQGQWLDQHL